MTINKDIMNIFLLKNLTQGTGPCVPVQVQVDTELEKYYQKRKIDKRSRAASERYKEIVGDIEKATDAKDEVRRHMENDLTEFETEIDILTDTAEDIEKKLRIRLQEMREEEEKYMNSEVEKFRQKAEQVKVSHRTVQEETRTALEKMQNDMVAYKEQRVVEQKIVNRAVARGMAEILLQHKIQCEVNGTMSDYLILTRNNKDHEVQKLADELGINVTDYPTNKALLFETGSRYPVFVGEL